MKKEVNDGNPSIFSFAELKVVELLARGLSEKEIAHKICLSPHTVGNHLRNVKERHNLSKNAEIILLYIAYLNGKKFNLSTIRQVGISIIFVLVNLCEYTRIIQ